MKTNIVSFLIVLISYLFIAMNPNVSAQGLQQDSLALIALFENTDGTNWKNNTNWLTTQPLSTWYGITVENERITRIDLGNNNLVGTIPTEIGNLTNLKSLILRSNQLSGVIPSEIGNITNLESLNFYNNQLSGAIPSEIGNLTNLKELFLSNNQLSGAITPEIGNLANLKSFFLKYNKLSGTIPPEIGNLTNLESLHLSDNQLSSAIPPEIGNLANLKRLHLSWNQLSGAIPSEIGNLSNLTGLYIRNNRLSGAIPHEIGNLSNLETLNFISNQLSGAIPPEIGHLTNLKWLFLSYNQLSGTIPPEIGNLTNLTTLSLYSNELSGTIPPEIGNLTNLKGLYLAGNQLSGSIPTEIGNLSNLVSLSLGSNQLSGAIPTEISNLTNLRGLYLSHNELADAISPEILNLTNLTELNLGSNQLSGSIPPEIGNLTNLKMLRINSNQFNDLPDLSSITTLTELQVQNNKLTFEDIEPNIGIPNFTYSPQDSVGTEQDTTAMVGSSLTISVTVGGAHNQYQWFKDGAPISGVTNSSYSISSVDSSHDGSYTCEITNTIATALTLYSRQINVTVRGIGIRIEPPKVQSVVDDTFTINVAIDNVTNLGSFQFDIEYSTRVVHADTAWLGSFLSSTGRTASPVGPTIDNSNDPGKVTFGGFSFGTTSGPDGSGVLAFVRFTARDTGSTILALKNVQVTDINGQAQNVDVISDGHVRIVMPGDIPSLASLFVSPNPTKAGEITVTINFDAGAGQIDNSVSPLVTFSPANDTTKLAIQQTSFHDSAWKGTAIITENMNNGTATIQVEGVQNTLGIIMKPLNNAGSFIIDTVAPKAFYLLSPPDSSWRNAALPALSWNPSEDTTSGLASYMLYLNSELNIDNIAPSQTSIVPSSELEDGDYKWWVAAKDNAGNIRKCNKEWLLGVDKTPPTSTITNPRAGDEVSGKIMIEGTANDGQGIGLDSVFVRTDNGETWYPATNTSEDFNTWEYEWNVSQDGPIAILTKAIDKLGNEETPHGITVTDLPENAQNQIPTDFALLQNYPNPFNPETSIQYQIPKETEVKLEIFNNLGQRVATLVNKHQPAGYYTVKWNGKDEAGRNVASGIYFYRLESNDFVKIKKLVLVR